MNKGKKKMKKNKETKFKVKGPEAIEDGLMDMGRAIEAGGPWTHPEMERIPEWRGRLTTASRVILRGTSMNRASSTISYVLNKKEEAIK